MPKYYTICLHLYSKTARAIHVTAAPQLNVGNIDYSQRGPAGIGAGPASP